MTDRAMVYIVFGPPTRVEGTIDGESWPYYDRDDDVYVFDRVTESAFGHYVLGRAPRYHEPWQRAVERWRRGG
jgi:hypothetical protein